ncbi:uncharacterized protein LOC144925615 isoform X1 [Branchiostoma floridae x Branchiostoma belcheri]
MALLVLFGVALLLGATKVEDARLAPKQDPKTIEELWEADDSVDLAVNEQSRREAFADRIIRCADSEDNSILSDAASELGHLTPLSCEDDSEGIPLCRECSFLRTLPADYHPRYLVERKCKGKYCLSNEGNCVQQYMEVEVRNIAPDREGEVSLVLVGTACRCFLNENSVFKVFLP